MALNIRLKTYMEMSGLTFEDIAMQLQMTAYELKNFIDHNEGLYVEHLEMLAREWPEMMAFLFQTPISACVHNEGVPGVEWKE